MISIFDMALFQSTNNVIAYAIYFTDNIVMGKPAVKQYEAGINAGFPSSINHADQRCGLFTQGLFTSAPSDCSFIDVPEFIIRTLTGRIKRNIQRKKVDPIVISQLQALIAWTDLSYDQNDS
jgi:hypothetical protein